MTDFNNFNAENENINAEGSNIPSAEGVLEETEQIPQLKDPFEIKQEIRETIDSNEIVRNQAINVNFNKMLDPELFVEKNKIKEDARTIGAAFLVMYGFIFLLNLIVVIAEMILQLSSLTQAAEILLSPAVIQVEQILFSSAAFTLPFLLIYRLSGIRISNLISFSVPKIKNAVPYFLMGVAFCSFANIVSSIAESMFEKSNIDYNVTRPENPSGFFGFMLALISTVIVPALVEEFACRGLMLGMLKKHGEGFAIIASSLLFGLMHGNFEQIPFAFMVGLVLGFITVKSGTILIAMAVHAFNNFVSIVFEYFLADVPQNIQNTGYLIFLIICLLLGIFTIYLFRKKEDFYSLEPSKFKAGEGKKLIWFFTSVPIIIYTVLCLMESLQFFEF